MIELQFEASILRHKMCSLIRAIVIVFVTWNLQPSMAYQWLSLKSGDPIPEHAVLIDVKLNTYVGRARHYDSILPAEIYDTPNRYALVSSCSQEIVKTEFEVLVATERCEWKDFSSIGDIPANVVRAGTAKNGEPIFIGSTRGIYIRWGYVDSNTRIASIFMTTDQVRNWKDMDFEKKYSLICDDDNNWIDTSSGQIPNNTISGGQSEQDHEIFVARLLNGCGVVPGEVIPALGIATGVYDGKDIVSSFCQVLIGDEEKFRWVSARNGEIPDYAVVAGKYGTKELMYVARVNKRLGYVLYKDVAGKTDPYEILVEII